MTFFSVLLGRVTHSVFMDGWEGIMGYVSVRVINDQSKHVRWVAFLTSFHPFLSLCSTAILYQLLAIWLDIPRLRQHGVLQLIVSCSWGSSFTVQSWWNCLCKSHPGLDTSASCSFYCPEMAWMRSSSELSWAPRSRFISWHRELMCFLLRHTNHRCEVCGLPNIPTRILNPHQLSQASQGAFTYAVHLYQTLQCGSLGKWEHRNHTRANQN